jgi:predicted alpha/beta hydrolase
MPEWVSATTSDGVTLSLARFAVPAASSRRAVALLTHAMMANAGYLGRFASFAAERGVECWTLDFRGHGRSVPPSPRDPVARWCFDTYVVDDLPAAIGAIREIARIDPTEIAYVGHSLGGLAGLAAFGTGVLPPPRRLVLVATSVWHPGPRGPIVRRAGGALFDRVSSLVGYLPIRSLRAGTDDESRGYAAQFAMWARTGVWSSVTGRDYQGAISRIASPALALVGDGDRLCSEADARDLSDRLAGPVTLRRVGRAQGDAVDPDHFGFFTRRELASTLWPEWIDFLAARRS